jgi:hypothetical protein
MHKKPIIITLADDHDKNQIDTIDYVIYASNIRLYLVVEKAQTTMEMKSHR